MKKPPLEHLVTFMSRRAPELLYYLDLGLKWKEISRDIFKRLFSTFCPISH